MGNQTSVSTTPTTRPQVEPAPVATEPSKPPFYSSFGHGITQEQHAQLADAITQERIYLLEDKPSGHVLLSKAFDWMDNPDIWA